MIELTPPGQIFRADFRIQPPDTSSQQQRRPSLSSLKILQWNIERGYKLPGIIDELKRLDVDVISLQEVDVACERSGATIDTGLEIAKALHMNYVFLSEFEELKSCLRSPREQGGGVHGNAILTKHDIVGVDIIKHRVHPVDWNKPTHPLARKQPRRGERAVLRAIIDTSSCFSSSPNALCTKEHTLVVYNAHFEVFCGMLARIAQLSDIFSDSRRMFALGYTRQIIAGDLNTMAHGIARLSPNYCSDRMRFYSFGRDEAVMWENHVLNYTNDEVPNPALIRWGMDPAVAQDASNPGFVCPFDARTTTTLDNPTYKWFGVSLMKGKLDWLLLRDVVPSGKCIGNLDYSLSDHRWISVTINPL